jgi:hypothetical protein
MTDVRAVLDGWRDELLDLSGANRLINLGADPAAAVEIVGPSPKSIVEAFRQGDMCEFLGADREPVWVEPRPAVLLRTALPEDVVRPALRRLETRARREFLDRAVPVLHLAVGVLHWQDEDGHAYDSPILFLPVDLAGGRLRARAEDPVVNPALAVRLRRLGVELPVVDTVTDLDVTVLWARLDVAISEHRGWHADETILLSRFTFHRETAYRDLFDAGETLLGHPVVRALATGDETGELAFEPIPPERIDELAPAEDVPLVLDADADQRACVAAAVAGHSFVVEGPPGTGKSQTVATMAGCLLHAGKRVLIVSERAAALDTVQERLTGAGLGDYLLALHSDGTGRAGVAQALLAALDSEPVPVSGLDPLDRQAVRRRRERLNAYAEAMNRVRRPLGRSLHDVLGICAHLLDVPSAPVPHSMPVDLTPEAFDRVRDAVGRFAETWRESFRWHDVIDRNAMDDRLRRARATLAGLAEVARQNAPLAAAFDLHQPADAAVLAALVAHAARRPHKINEDWLTVPSLRPVEDAVAELGRHLSALRYGGVAWTDLPTAAELTSAPDLSHLTPEPVDLLPLTAAKADELARRFGDEADLLEQHQQSLDRVTARLGLPNVVTFPDTAPVVALADLIGRPHKPEPAWFEPDGRAKAREAAGELRRRVEAAVAAEAQARRHFSEGVLEEPVDELAERFATRYRGARRLFGSYRRDKKAAAEVALPEVKPSQAVANLEAAAAWKQATEELAEAERRHAQILGRHWKGVDTDFAAIDEALRTVVDVLEVTPAEALPAVVVHVCAPRPNSALLRIVGEARDVFDHWRDTLHPAPDAAPRPELGEGAVQGAVAWLRAHVEPLTKAARLTRAYSAPTGRALTLAEATEIAQQRQAAVEAEAAIWESAARHAAILGSGYRGTKTNDKALAEIVAWTADARRLRAGADVPLTAAQARALAESRPSPLLADAVADWQEARRQVIEAFAPTRRAELAAELDDYGRAHALLRELVADADGQYAWFAHADARQVFTDYGLDAAVAYCQEQGIPHDRMWPVLERALYRGWAEAVIRDDDDLQPVTAEDRNHLVEEFRLLDNELTAAAAADVATAVEARRPTASDLIRREGNKQTGHVRVRDLIAQTRDTTLALKPCFLMSPYAVSRLLPPEIRFDVVIVDEASRLATADAIPAVYRGAALIVVGDSRQLPPTDFYDRYADVPVEYSSLLDPAKAALPALALTTHYRSRHESLITFANHAYYQGRLTTFPRADTAEPDHGVELVAADGIYRRGSGDDNPVEAEVVAERVLHHFVTRPDRTVGVVALSVAQAEAIEHAVRHALADHPELHDRLGDDRLTGFFVKTPESVQGDVRDVVVLSVGYGYDEQDNISASFGALNRPKGWRRLNVAVTRARQRVEVVSSIRAADVPELGNESVRHLKAYLEVAQRGTAVLGAGHAEAAGPFEDSVLAAIRSWGFTVRAGIDTAGQRIDLAVVHPDHDGEVYAIGIECDGPAYRAIPAARDRDRIREQVLRGLGWNLHRIWATAWYRNRTEEESRLLGAIERAVEVPGRSPRSAAVSPGLADVGPGPRPYRRVGHDLLSPESVDDRGHRPPGL